MRSVVVMQPNFCWRTDFRVSMRFFLFLIAFGFIFLCLFHLLVFFFCYVFLFLCYFITCQGTALCRFGRRRQFGGAITSIGDMEVESLGYFMVPAHVMVGMHGELVGLGNVGLGNVYDTSVNIDLGLRNVSSGSCFHLMCWSGLFVVVD